MPLSIEAHADVDLVGHPVSGRLRLTEGSYPVFDTTYDYLPTEYDGNRDLFIKNGIYPQSPTGYGLKHETDDTFVLKGEVYTDVKRDFSLFQLKAKVSEYALNTTKVSNRFSFKFCLLGSCVDWDEKAFTSALITFPEMSPIKGFSDRAKKLMNLHLKDEFESNGNLPFPVGEQIWKIAVNKEVDVELGVALAVVTDEEFLKDRELLGVESNVYIRVVSKQGLLSVKTLWNKYVDPIAKLFSLSAGRTITPSQVFLTSTCQGPYDNQLISADIKDDGPKQSERSTQSYFDPSLLSKNSFKSWIEKFPDFEYFIDFLLRVFPEESDFLIVGTLLSQLESLHKKASGVDHGMIYADRVQGLIDDWASIKTIFWNGLDSEETSKRIKKLRNLVAHEALDQPSMLRDLEMEGIFEFSKILYLATIMRLFKIPWVDTLKNGRIVDHGLLSLNAVSTFHLGNCKWDKLN